MSDSDSSGCVATVVTEDFVPGALVALRSFQQHNAWFSGDFVVIHDGLSDSSQQAFRTLFDRIRFERISDDVRDWSRRMVKLRPELSAQQPQFYSLDVFRLRGYEKVLFCDSDLLFRGDIRELWSRPEPLLCCRDRPAYLGHARDRHTFAMCTAAADSLTNTFNSGFLLIDRALLNETESRRLFSVLSPQDWKMVTAAHTDQLILNLAFAGRQHLVGGTFNLLLKHATVIRKHAGIGIADAKVLHYNLSAKPWQPGRIVHLCPSDPMVLEAIKWWNQAFADCMQQSCLRSNLSTGQSIRDD